MATYLDSSAIVRLVVRERESAALRRYLRRRPLVSSALARTAVQRALLPAGDEAVGWGRTVLQRLDLIRLNDRVLNAAGVLQPAGLRSLDAIYLATARLLGAEVTAIVTYDDRMAAAAERLGNRGRPAELRQHQPRGHDRGPIRSGRDVTLDFGP